MFGLYVSTKKYQSAQEEIKELNRRLKDIEKDYDLRERKAVATLEIATEKRITKVENDCNKMIEEIRQECNDKITAMTREYDSKVSNLRSAHSEELSKIKSESAENHYSKLSDSMTKLHEQGNAQTQFIEKIATSMVEKMGGGDRLTSKEHLILENK